MVDLGEPLVQSVLYNPIQGFSLDVRLQLWREPVPIAWAAFFFYFPLLTLFQQELLAYCESDLKLLKQGCLTFKRDFQALAHFNPFDQKTIAWACNRDLRMNRMAEETIASEPLQGWRPSTNHSQAAMEWLKWQESQLGRPLQHARNQGEFRIPGTHYTVDGYDNTTHTVYEFHGCYWHGCPRCHPQRQETHARLLDRTMEDAYRTTQAKVQFLRDQRYSVVEMWECVWRQRQLQDTAVAKYVPSLHLQGPLQPREAFFGGRTNVVRLHRIADATQGEEIRYYDYTSLYPWVNKNGRYPLGHPEFVYAPDSLDLSPYFGLAKCPLQPTCTIPSCPIAPGINSPSPCAEPVSKSSLNCLSSTRPGIVPTHLTCVRLNSRRPFVMCC